MKAILLHDIELSYYDPNLPVDIYADASDYQMGAAIFQNGSIIAYWSKRLTSAQLNYSTMEKELLAVVYCLKEFHDLFLGAKCTVYTDRCNLTFKTLNAQCVLRWRLFLDQYDVTFKYIPGPDNVLAHCFSSVPRMAPPTDGKRIAISGKEVDFAALKTQEAENDIFWEDAMMADILGHLPDSLADDDCVHTRSWPDPVTNLVEMIRIKNKSMLHVSEQFENVWLSRYPKPNSCIYDNGTEFTGWLF
jgi:hypothetical protein